MGSVTVWDKYGNNTNRMHMYFDAKHSVRFNGKYTLYVGLASSVSFVLVLVPTLFILFYPNVFFQRCLQYFTKCKFCKFRMLHELATITQGCYKNGTSPGTRDYRWFAGFYMLLKIVFLVILNQLFSFIS